MKNTKLAAKAILAGGLLLPANLFGQTQVGDLRISPDTYAGRDFFFDLGFSETTRGVTDAPVQLPSVFSGITSNPSGGLIGDRSFDLSIRSFSASTTIYNLNRFGTAPGGTGNVGTMQWNVDLTPLQDFLESADPAETLTALDLNLMFNPQDDGKAYDVYLSYTNPAESITLTGISPTSAGENYTNLWDPAQTAAADDIINGTHRVLNVLHTGDLATSTSLLSLYEAGVREVNVIVAMGSFYSNRQFIIQDGCGITFDTDDPAPSEQISDFRIPGFGGKRHVYDRIAPANTNVSGGVVALPTRFSATSQNQDNNFTLGPVAFYSLDGDGTDGGSFGEDFGGTVVGSGGDGIGATASDEFQLTAYQQGGNFDIEVTLDPLNLATANARAGLMIREGTAPDSPHVFLGLQGSGEPVVVIRDAPGEVSTEAVGTASGTAIGILSASLAGDVVTVTTSGDHIFFPGDTISLSGLGFTTTDPNGSASIDLVPTDDSFSFTLIGADETFTASGSSMATLAQNAVLRIKRTADLFEFFVNDSPAPTASASVVLFDDLLIGFAATSGDDANEVTAVFSDFDALNEWSDTCVALAVPNAQGKVTDIGLRTFSSVTRINTLNRFGNSVTPGFVQWAIDLTPLDDYIANNSLTPSALELRLLADVSDGSKPVDVYLSYTNPAEGIALTGIEAIAATSADLGALNYSNLFLPAQGASEDSIVNGTHKVLRPAGLGNLDETVDLLALYDSGVRELNLMISTNSFFSGRTIAITEGSGIFLETDSGTPAKIEIVDASRSGNDFAVTAGGLAIGAPYHLIGGPDLSNLLPLAGSEVTTVAAETVFTANTTEEKYFVRVVEGALPPN